MVMKKLDKWKIEEGIREIKAKEPLPIVIKSVPKFEAAVKIGDRLIGVERETPGMAIMMRTSKSLAFLGKVVDDIRERKVVLVPKKNGFEAIGLHVKTVEKEATFHYKPFKARMILRKHEVKLLPF